MFRVWILALLLLSRFATAETLKSTDPEFEFDVPSGFAPSPHKPESFRWTWMRQASEEEVPIFIGIEVFEAEISRERMRDHEAEFRKMFPRFNTSRFSESFWSRWKIDVLEAEVTEQGIPMFVAGAQIPLRNKAIQILVIGPVEKRSEIRSTLDASIAATRGSSSWEHPWETRQFWVIFWVCTIGYQMALLYFLAWLCFFSWAGDVLLRTRMWWNAIAAVLMLGLAVTGDIFASGRSLFGKGKASKSEVSYLLVGLACLPCLLSHQRLKS